MYHLIIHHLCCLSLSRLSSEPSLIRLRLLGRNHWFCTNRPKNPSPCRQRFQYLPLAPTLSAPISHHHATCWSSSPSESECLQVNFGNATASWIPSRHYWMGKKIGKSEGSVGTFLALCNAKRKGLCHWALFIEGLVNGDGENDADLEAGLLISFVRNSAGRTSNAGDIGIESWFAGIVERCGWTIGAWLSFPVWKAGFHSYHGLPNVTIYILGCHS